MAESVENTVKMQPFLLNYHNQKSNQQILFGRFGKDQNIGLKILKVLNECIYDYKKINCSLLSETQMFCLGQPNNPSPRFILVRFGSSSLGEGLCSLPIRLTQSPWVG